MDYKYVQEKFRRIRDPSKRRKPGFHELNFDITYDYVWSIYPDNELCPVFGFKMDYKSENYDLRPTMDRVNPNLGYEKGNVIWISQLANRMKSDLDLEELVRIGEWAKKELTQ